MSIPEEIEKLYGDRPSSLRLAALHGIQIALSKTENDVDRRNLLNWSLRESAAICKNDFNGSGE